MKANKVQVLASIVVDLEKKLLKLQKKKEEITYNIQKVKADLDSAQLKLTEATKE